MPAPQCSAHSVVASSKIKSNASILRTALLAVTWSLSASLAPIAASAAPTVVVNNPEQQVQVEDPQVAPQPATPFNEINPQSPNQQEANPGETPNALENPDSLASGMQPSDSELSAANQELLSRNAQLQRDVNDLETRVNVLINERSGQLFMYGAVTVAVSLFLGILLGGFVFSRRDRW